MEEITNLEFTPLLKQLLISYCLRHYEESAILDEYHLLMEHERLVRENKLNELFENEHMEKRMMYEYQSGQNIG